VAAETAGAVPAAGEEAVVASATGSATRSVAVTAAAVVEESSPVGATKSFDPSMARLTMP